MKIKILIKIFKKQFKRKFNSNIIKKMKQKNKINIIINNKFIKMIQNNLLITKSYKIKLT